MKREKFIIKIIIYYTRIEIKWEYHQSFDN